ncbi:glycosyltransferase [Herbiconiux sp. CPCC 205716]|uniref:Glycosyltransferase n=1 Tax=Herbiconiux gentiana TaxID=2970912 RepID=A0ABT2GMQ4_9MICO|nr:glycosyltransferase [Herbiconiux gentiana]MCS5716026.1 glycosyltransferase [Herbiconiux gentiana]
MSGAGGAGGLGGQGARVPGNDWSVLEGVRAEHPPLVSVVVVHYEQPDDLARTLGALGRQTYPRELLEVIVVDDGSAVAPSVPAGVRLITLPDRGFRAATARNRGAAAARGEVLCFLDADTAPEPSYVAELTRLPAVRDDAVTVGRRRHAAFENGSSPVEVAGPLAPAPVEVAGPLAELPEPTWLHDAYARSRDLLDADQRSYRYVISSVLACSSAFFAATGGFDEGFDEYGGEDWEWAHRAFTRGAVLAHVPTAVAWHNGADLAGRADDPDDLRRRMNRETLLLLNRIGVPGSVGRGLRSAAPDIVITLPPGTPAATAVCANLLLEALPAARLVLDDSLAALFPGDARVLGRSSSGASTSGGSTSSGSTPGPTPGGAAATTSTRADARVTVTADTLVTVPRADRASFCTALARATDEVGVGTLGWIELHDPATSLTLTVAATRAEHRRDRRPDADEFTVERRPAPLRALPDEPDLAAHLGGWSD